MWTSELIDEGYYWEVDLADSDLEIEMIECRKINNCLCRRYIDRTHWIPVKKLDGYRYNSIEEPIFDAQL